MASRLLLCLLMCTYCAFVHGVSRNGFAVVPTSSFFASQPACSAAASPVPSGPNRASMPLVHRHGPCAPPSGDSGQPPLAERLRRDRDRARYILHRASGGRAMTELSDNGTASIPTNLGDTVESLEYVVTLGIGTPPVEQTLLMDTGSDLSWVQCAPCNATSCYPQKDPLFDPSKSSTYRSIPCGSDACKNLTTDHYSRGCAANSTLCGFSIKYGDGSTTTGVYSSETLALAPGATVRDFGFGCGNNQRGPNDRYDGLLGLGGAPESLVSQTAVLYGGVFSYCLPPGSRTAGFLTLGAPSKNTADFVFAPLQSFPNVPTFYMVTLEDISVAGKPLRIPPAVFSGGMVIDSGTVITLLPSTAYTSLRTAFRGAMSAYPLLPPNDDNDLDTCYNFTGFSNVMVPTVSLSFSGGATIDLDVPSGVLLEGCLAFAEGSQDGGFGIIGNVNQRTFEVLYDSGKGHVGFRPGAC
ncbi:hypothetical protein ACP4OV_001364 [Aristida adscensionis]